MISKSIHTVRYAPLNTHLTMQSVRVCVCVSAHMAKHIHSFIDLCIFCHRVIVAWIFFFLLFQTISTYLLHLVILQMRYDCTGFISHTETRHESSECSTLIPYRFIHSIFESIVLDSFFLCSFVFRYTCFDFNHVILTSTCRLFCIDVFLFVMVCVTTTV